MYICIKKHIYKNKIDLREAKFTDQLSLTTSFQNTDEPMETSTQVIDPWRHVLVENP